MKINSDKKLYRVGEVVRATPFTRQTIHNYASMGLIKVAARTGGGYRLYDESVFERLKRIQDLRKIHSLRRIFEILNENSERTRKDIERPTTSLIPLKLYRISEVMQKTNLSRQMIHRYTTIGLIKEESWTEGGARLYDDSVFKKIQRIIQLKKAGYSLKEIKILLGQGNEKVTNSISEGTKGLLGIDEISKMSGVSHKTIYSYLEIGLIKERNQTKSGRLFFDKSTAKRLKLISRLNQSGYTLGGIRKLFIEK